MHGKDTRNGNAALFAAAELKGGLIKIARIQSHILHGMAHPLLQLLAAEPHVLRTKSDIGADSLLKELILGVLKHQSHAEAHIADLFGIFPNVLPCEINMTLGGLQQPVEVLYQSGFAAARVTDHTEKLARQDIKADIPHRILLKGCTGTIHMAEVFHAHDRFQCKRSLL